MKPRITLITLGVDDLDRAVHFYRDGLGLPTQGIVGKEFEYGAVAFFDLQPGLKLAVWPRKSLAHDAGIPVSAPCPTELSIGHNVLSTTEVDTVMKQAKKAGAVIVRRNMEEICRNMGNMRKYGRKYGDTIPRRKYGDTRANMDTGQYGDTTNMGTPYLLIWANMGTPYLLPIWGHHTY
jgi:catechol 2,3-dioxygenase-like lactoylglutathione lyase family enzyme